MKPVEPLRRNKSDYRKVAQCFKHEGEKSHFIFVPVISSDGTTMKKYPPAFITKSKACSKKEWNFISRNAKTRKVETNNRAFNVEQIHVTFKNELKACIYPQSSAWVKTAIFTKWIA